MDRLTVVEEGEAVMMMFIGMIAAFGVSEKVLKPKNL